ncbi:MAG: hypothetical protein VX768_10470 [Planctomycetota bacterium]|nr:hypothetical protein [Planctomycetota bacterium]
MVQISAGPLQRNVNLTPRGTEFPQSSGFLNASFQKPLFHADRVLSRVAHELNGSRKDFFKLLTFDYRGEASLSWYLSNVEKLSLLYPFLSDEQAKALLTDPSLLQKSQSEELISFKEGRQSALLRGASRYRKENFRRSEELRSQMDRQLNELEKWWKNHQQPFN